MSSSNQNKSPLHEKKIPSKFLTRETSSHSSPSFSVYYGKAAAGSVPFNWESQPGTPKHPSTTTQTTKLNQHAFPPLTPPPSYSYYSSPESFKKKSKSQNLLHIILPKLTLIIRWPNLTYRSSSSSSSCSSSEPSPSAVGCKTRKRSAATARLSGPKTHFSSSKEEGFRHTLMPCFGPRP